MTNTQHTPGPWTVENDGLSLSIHSGRTGGIVLWDERLTTANARLIASAPDLLDALEEFCRECDGYLDGNDGSPWGTLLKGRAAIAKATGQ